MQLDRLLESKTSWRFRPEGLADARALNVAMRTPSFSNLHLKGADWFLLGSQLLLQVAEFLLERLPMVPEQYPTIAAAIAAGCDDIAVDSSYHDMRSLEIRTPLRLVSRGAMLQGCITVMGAPLEMDGVVLTGPGTGLIARSGANVRLKNCKVEGKTFHGIIVDQGADCELIDSVIRNNALRGLLVLGQVYQTGTIISENGIDPNEKDSHFLYPRRCVVSW